MSYQNLSWRLSCKSKKSTRNVSWILVGITESWTHVNIDIVKTITCIQRVKFIIVFSENSYCNLCYSEGVIWSL